MKTPRHSRGRLVPRIGGAGNSLMSPWAVATELKWDALHSMQVVTAVQDDGT